MHRIALVLASLLALSAFVSGAITPGHLDADAASSVPAPGGVLDVEPSPTQDTCGDGRCQPPDDCRSCPQDCGDCCGDGRCQPPEDCRSCSQDCGSCCGDGRCQPPEDCSSCDRDCGRC